MKKEFTQHQLKMLNSLLRSFELAYGDDYRKYDVLTKKISELQTEKTIINDRIVNVVQAACKSTDLFITQSLLRKHP